MEKNITEQLLKLNKLKMDNIPFSKFGPTFKEVLNAKNPIIEDQKKTVKKSLMLNKIKKKEENSIFIKNI